MLWFENNIDLGTTEDLTCTEKSLHERKSHLGEDGLFSYCLAGSPHKKHLDLIGADQTMPVFEGFIIDVQRENGQQHIAGDGISFDKLDLPNATIERASVLEQLCKSASMHTPLSHFSATFKLHRAPDLHQSVPDGLLEPMDLRSTLSLTGDGGRQLSASDSCVNKVNCAFEGVSYSDCLPYSNARFGWSVEKPYTSPVGKLWERFTSNSSSSEKQRSVNPELTCFPIEEDPSISEENENTDEVVDTIQEDTGSITMNSGAKREPLAEITEACLNPPASVSAVKIFPDRGSLDSVNAEVSFTGTHNRVKQKLGNRYSNKRRCTNMAKENQTLSVGPNGIKKATESLNNRFSKPKLSGKTSLRKGGQSLSEREPRRNNIVSNITSFVPLVQQKQAATVCTGKRDIKVKALEAAEATKRLEEKRENERKMKKEALKLERARMEQENLRQMELKKKKKEEAQRKKDADMAARKRLREEEERKEKERKRKRIGEAPWRQREQEEKFRAGKVEKEVQCGATDERVNSGKESNEESGKRQRIEKERGDDHIAKKPETEPRTAGISTSDVRQASIVLKDCEAGDSGKAMIVLDKSPENDNLVTNTSREKSYEISPYQCSDDEEEEEEEEDDIPARKFIPSWASKKCVAFVMPSQQKVDPDVIFPSESFCSMDKVLLPRKLQLK
uniref:Inner centromere protein ARK-binding domain-containing protein n=1 Tax=Davidia involucrata TaxID=16924 RepID=A0A5B6Z078_DAVIN